jgi:hypothetical protein
VVGVKNSSLDFPFFHIHLFFAYKVKAFNLQRSLRMTKKVLIRAHTIRGALGPPDSQLVKLYL